MRILQNGRELCSAEIADSFLSRLKGLMFRKKLDRDSGLFIQNCSSIHTCFMRFPIDVIYVDRKYTVLYTETVAPWRIGKIVKHTRHVLELPAGNKEKFAVGIQLQLADE